MAAEVESQQVEMSQTKSDKPMSLAVVHRLVMIAKTDDGRIGSM